MGNLDRDTVKYIFNELDGILGNYGDVVKGYAWSLVYAINAYTDLLVNYFGYFNSKEVGDLVRKIADLLNELDKLSPSLGVIAWAYALDQALMHEYVREVMEEKLGIDVVDKAIEVLGGLGRLRGRVQELMGDREFMGYVESRFVKADEEAVKEVILDTASHVLGNCLVSLALTGDYETISKLLEEHWRVLNADKQASVLTRLVLNALLGLKDRKDQLGSELKDKLSVEPKELIDILRSHIHSAILPALMVAFGVIKPEDGIKLCEGGEVFINVCTGFVLAAKGDSAAVKLLREGVIEWVINAFNNSLKGLSFDAKPLFDELKGLVNGLDGRSLVQLIAPETSMALLALMLRALINGDEELAKAHALYGAMSFTEKLPARLFLEAYGACCDPNNDEFRRAVARLFFYHV
jgi:hypothetical protein